MLISIRPLVNITPVFPMASRTPQAFRGHPGSAPLVSVALGAHVYILDAFGKRSSRPPATCARFSAEQGRIQSHRPLGDESVEEDLGTDPALGREWRGGSDREREYLQHKYLPPGAIGSLLSPVDSILAGSQKTGGLG
ncbi:unnamed protein product [Lampetra fluviatilis]